MLDIAIWAAGLILALAAWGSVYRIWKGPALLDRVLASDVLLSILTAALCLLMIETNSQHYIVLLVVIATVGFVGSVTVARFADNRKLPETQPLAGRTRRRRKKRKAED